MFFFFYQLLLVTAWGQDWVQILEPLAYVSSLAKSWANLSLSLFSGVVNDSIARVLMALLIAPVISQTLLLCMRNFRFWLQTLEVKNEAKKAASEKGRRA